MRILETITKRKDGRYMGRFPIGRADDGKLLYQYVYGNTYEEAEKKLMIGKAIESEYLSGWSVTVKQAYTEWINATANRIKESSLANYKQKFEKHILPAFGDILCSELSANAINDFIAKKLESGLSVGFIRDIFIVFKTMLKFAQEEHDFKLSLKNIVLPKINKKSDLAIEKNEQKALVSFLKEHIDLTSFGILISLLMGVRIGELCGLRWSDVDFSNKTLQINRTVQRISVSEGNRKTKVIISTPKSESSHRVISILDCLMQYFELFRAGGYVLSGREKVIEPHTMQYRYKKVLAAAKISEHNYHKLRHTFATNCIGSGFDAKTLSNVLGHSNITLTLTRYAYLGLAESYLGMGDTKKALEILYKGLENTGDTRLQSKIHELTEPEQSSVSTSESSVELDPRTEIYSSAVKSMGENAFENAIELFQSITGYLDSDELLIECKYLYACQNMQNALYQDAILQFSELGDYKDSKANIEQCNLHIRYDSAVSLMNSVSYSQAMKEFEALGEFLDSRDKLKSIC